MTRKTFALLFLAVVAVWVALPFLVSTDTWGHVMIWSIVAIIVAGFAAVVIRAVAAILGR